MSEEEKDVAKKENEKIAFNNRICADTKPYFFGYIYDREMKKYKTHKDKYNRIAMLDFDKTLKEILESKDCSKEEAKLKRDYFKYSPLKRSKSVMNQLCMYIEDIEFENRWKNKCSKFDYRILMNDKDFKPNNNILYPLTLELKQFSSAYKRISIYDNETEEVLEDDYENMSCYSYLYEMLEDKISSIVSNKVLACDYMIYLSYNKFNSFGKSYLWEVYGDVIVENLKNNSNSVCFPSECVVGEEHNGKEYLGKYYTIKEESLVKAV